MHRPVKIFKKCAEVHKRKWETLVNLSLNKSKEDLESLFGNYLAIKGELRCKMTHKSELIPNMEITEYHLESITVK